MRKRSRPSSATALPLDLAAAYAVTDGSPGDAPLQRRGDPASPGEVVPRGTPRFAFLSREGMPEKVGQGSGRLELAHWLTRPDNPLTARVLVNRIWQNHFGRGIVATASNFGVRGEPPSHPELLDWLAKRLVESGWSIKTIHREILLSRTYQLASTFDARDAELDPDNRLLWRFPRLRLDAEAIRDAMLAVSGNLDETAPKPHPFPPIENWHWTQHDAFKTVYPTSQRSVYLMTQRLIKHPYLAIFDGPDTNVSTEARPRSTVPLQALYLLNNPFVETQAQAFARRLMAMKAGDDGRITAAYRLAWSRPADDLELARNREFLDSARCALAAAQVPADRREVEAWTALAKIMLTANEFLYID